MKLNRQQFFDKLNKLQRAGVTDMSVQTTSQAIRVEYAQGQQFDLIMTTRTILVRDSRKEQNRSRAVATEAEKYRRWLREWKNQYSL